MKYKSTCKMAMCIVLCCFIAGCDWQDTEAASEAVGVQITEATTQRDAAQAEHARLEAELKAAQAKIAEQQKVLDNALQQVQTEEIEALENQLRASIKDLTDTSSRLSGSVSSAQQSVVMWNAALAGLQKSKESLDAIIVAQQNSGNDPLAVVTTVGGLLPPPFNSIAGLIGVIGGGIAEFKRRSGNKKSAAAFQNIDRATTTKSGSVRTIDTAKLRTLNGPAVSAHVETLLKA